MSSSALRKAGPRRLPAPRRRRSRSSSRPKPSAGAKWQKNRGRSPTDGRARAGFYSHRRRLGMANAGMVGLDWQQRINWDRLRKYRLERARARMKAAGLGAMLLMYDENVRYVTSTLTPG